MKVRMLMLMALFLSSCGLKMVDKPKYQYAKIDPNKIYASSCEAVENLYARDICTQLKFLEFLYAKLNHDKISAAKNIRTFITIIVDSDGFVSLGHLEDNLDYSFKLELNRVVLLLNSGEQFFIPRIYNDSYTTSYYSILFNYLNIESECIDFPSLDYGFQGEKFNQNFQGIILYDSDSYILRDLDFDDENVDIQVDLKNHANKCLIEDSLPIIYLKQNTYKMQTIVETKGKRRYK